MRLDEVLELLPETGLTVRRWDQWPATEYTEAHWTCVLEDGGNCDNMCSGPTALDALVGSLAKCGFNVTDDGT